MRSGTLGPRSLGLGEYEVAFRENGIDNKVLSKPTSQDLKELCVAALHCHSRESGKSGPHHVRPSLDARFRGHDTCVCTQQNRPSFWTTQTTRHRRTILSAIGELSGSPAAASASPRCQNGNIFATLSSVPLSRDAAERRQLTVMFCDLVGSTAMSACLDPRTCAASSGPSFHKPIARPVMSEYQ